MRKNAIDQAEDVACLSGKHLPTNLGRIATRQGIREILFRPLLADGGIGLLKDGFVVYVKADPDEGESFSEQFKQDGIGLGLPRHMIRRVRFTIAHEIAHTFFYDRRSRPPMPKTAGNS